MDKVKKAGATALLAAGISSGIVIPIGITSYYWNSRDEALQALAKYDQPVKIVSPQERKEILSHLDEIFENYKPDNGSDQAPIDYLKFLETEGYPINDGARMLDTLGNDPREHDCKSLGMTAANYLHFLKGQGYTVDEGIRIFEKTEANCFECSHNKIIYSLIPKFVSYIKTKKLGLKEGLCLLGESSGESSVLTH